MTKIGDILNGWEILDIKYNPIYKMRRKVKILDGEYKDKILYIIIDNDHKYIETDDNKKIYLDVNQYEYYKEL